MKIALFQMDIIWEKKLSNYHVGERAICDASRHEAELILFPEMSFTGFTMNTMLTQEDDGQTLGFVKKMAKDYRIAVGFGWVKACGEKAENHYTIVDETGSLISDYVKIHPFSYAEETKYFRGGDKINSFQWKGHSWCTFICYDLRFPEIFQFASESADVIIVPANWPKKRAEHWKALLKARAIENQSYILGINCVGNNGGQEYSGDTSAYSPEGILLGEISVKSEILFVELQELARDIRVDFPVKMDRKWDLYKELYDRRKEKNSAIVEKQ